MIITKTFTYDSVHILRDLKVNDTISRGMYLAGDAIDNSCNAGTFSDRFGTWSKVNVQALITILLAEYTARLDLEKNNVILRPGTACQYDKNTCVDIEGGHTFWNDKI